MFPKLKIEYLLYFVGAILAVICIGQNTARPVFAATATVEEGTNFSVSVAPDGHALAIDLQGTLWIVEKGVARAITDRMSDARLPTWSPDSRRLAFQSYRDGNWHIWVIDEDGRSLSQVTTGSDDNREPVWNSDGSSLYFASDRSGNYDIWRIDLKTRNLSQITTEKSDEFAPAINSAGELAYISKQAGWGGAIKVKIQKDSETPKTVYEVKNLNFAGLSWLPDGKLGGVTYDNKWTSEQTSLLRINPKTERAEILTKPDEDVFPFRVSYDKTDAIYYSADGKIKKLSPKGTTENIPFQASLKFDTPSYARKKYNFFDKSERIAKGILNPVLSPDGQSVAYTALGDIWVSTAGGRNHKVTDDVFIDVDPAFSPDGKQLVFSSDRAGSFDLWLHNLETKAQKQLTFTGYTSAPSWSSDGKQIAFLVMEEKYGFGAAELFVLDIDTGITKLIRKYGDGAGRPSWSPDGKFIAITAFYPVSALYREGANMIDIINVASGSKVTIEPEEGEFFGARDYTGPVWSPVGGSIATVMSKGLWLFPVDSDGRKTGDSKLLAFGVDGNPSWSGNGNELIFQTGSKLKKINLKTGLINDFSINLHWKPIDTDLKTRLRAGRVFDGIQKTYSHNMDILIEGNRIVDIVAAGTKPAFDGRLIDATNKTVIPGLIESHAHTSVFNGERLGRQWLSYGITTVRNPGSNPYDALENKEAIQSGSRIGPRTFFAGRPIDGSRLYYRIFDASASKASLQHELQNAIDLDYDLIKTYVRLSNSAQSEVGAFAQKHGIPVASHELYPAAAVGISSKEHLKGTARDGFGSGLSLRDRVYADVSAILSQSGMTLTPTISLLAGIALIDRESPEYFEMPQYLTFYTESERDNFRNKFLKSYFSDKSTEALRFIMTDVRKSLGKIVKAGGKVVAGTDCPLVPCGVTLHIELHLSSGEEGLSAYEALLSATAWAADAIGAGDQIGRIRPNMVADIVIIDGDPLNKISDTLKVDAVIANGRYFTVQDLLHSPTPK